MPGFLTVKLLLVSVMTVAVGLLLAFAYAAWVISRPVDYSKFAPMPLHKSHTETLACINFTATWCDETWSLATFMDEMTRGNEATLMARTFAYVV